ncbi:serpin family protein [Nocardioides sp.]|uniref:serpin family protein n=1 Tax=Nocardioides sp. TaxID=35761 RepID=UPI003515389C
MTRTHPHLPARRDLLRVALASALAGGSGGLLAGCSDDRPPPPAGSGAGRGAGAAAGASGLRQVAASTSRTTGDPTAVPSVVAGLQTFAARLHRQVVQEAGGANVVTSPSSVLVALGMTMAGAGGSTRDELAEVLGVGDLGQRWHRGLNALRRDLAALPGEVRRDDGSRARLVLTSADQLFGQRGVAWGRDFLDLLAAQYGAGMVELDIAADPEAARTLINRWVEQHTDDRIVDLLPDGALDVDSRLVLVDALRLVAPWRLPFEPSLTRPGLFRRDDGSVVQAPMMHRPDLRVRLRDDARFRSVTVPYAGRPPGVAGAGDGLAMTIVLPGPAPSFDLRSGPRVDLASIERLVEERGLGAVLPLGSPEVAVDLILPSWTTRTSVSLKRTLKALGVRAAFTPAADLSPMTDGPGERLRVSDVLHQAHLAVDEQGTEAAAATAVVVEGLSAQLVTDTVVVDRPFLYVVHDTASGVPLFLGRVSDPTL